MSASKAARSKNALKLRFRVKRRKPNFVRPESWRYVRLKENWRNPRGLDHKTRLSYKGWPPAASSGYGGPKVARHLHPSGYEEVLVSNAEQLLKITPETQAVRIAHTIGKRKRARILTEARRKKIVVLNLRKATEEPAREKLTEEEEKTEEAEEKTREPEKEKAAPKTKARKRRRRTEEQ